MFLFAIAYNITCSGYNHTNSYVATDNIVFYMMLQGITMHMLSLARIKAGEGVNAVGKFKLLSFTHFSILVIFSQNLGLYSCFKRCTLGDFLTFYLSKSHHRCRAERRSIL